MKKRVLRVLPVLMCAALLTACGATEESGNKSQKNEAAKDETAESDVVTTEKGLRIGLVTKVDGHPVFNNITIGAEDAAELNGDSVDSQGPTDASAEKQVEVINNFIAQKVDAICISAADTDSVSPALKKAMDAGIAVVSYDSDVQPDARNVFVNTFGTESVAKQMIDAANEACDGKGQIAILSAAATATNQNAWIAAMEEYLKEDANAGLEVVSTVYGDDMMDKSLQEANGLLQSYPDLKCIISPTAVGAIAAAKAVQDANLTGKVVVTGLAMPSEVAEYIKSGVVNKAFLYNPHDVGYVAELVAHAIAVGKATGAEGDAISVGDMGERKVSLGLNGETEIIVDDAFEFNSENIDEWAAKF